MFGQGIASDAIHSLQSSSYREHIRSAHALADMLKRIRPHLVEQVNELQAKVVRCQNTLDSSKQQLAQAVKMAEKDTCDLQVSPRLSEDTLAALQELEEATQALLALRREKTPR